MSDQRMSQRLWERGTLATIDVYSVTAQESLDPEDVGADRDRLSDIVHLGRKTLFSKDHLRDLRKAEGAARQALYLWSTSFPIGGLRFVANASMPELKSRLAEVQAKHSEAVAEFRRNFDTWRDEMLAQHPDQLEPSDYERTRRLLESSRCRIVFSTFSVDLTGESRQREEDVLEEFTTQAVTELRETVATAARNLATKLVAGDKITEKSLNAMRRLVQRSRAANFMDDPVTTDALDTLESELGARSAKALRASDNQKMGFRRSLETIVEQATEADTRSVVGSFLGRYVEMSAKEPDIVEQIQAVFEGADSEDDDDDGFPEVTTDRSSDGPSDVPSEGPTSPSEPPKSIERPPLPSRSLEGVGGNAQNGNSSSPAGSVTELPPDPYYRKTKQGEWVVCGSAEQIQVGTIMVRTKAGELNEAWIVKVGKPFTDRKGRQMVYGYLASRSR